MTIAEEIIHDLKRLRIKANEDILATQKQDGLDLWISEDEALAFKNGLTMAIRVATQINNRRKRKS